MKPFNIKEYEAGNKNVVTRDGRPVEILKTNCNSVLPVVVLYDDNDVDFVTEDGKNVTYNTERDSRDHISCNDLFFADEDDLTKFEQSVKSFMENSMVFDLSNDECIKDICQKLLPLAKEDIDKNPEIMNKEYEAGWLNCQKDLLKNLPKFYKLNEVSGYEDIPILFSENDKIFLDYKGYRVNINDVFEKLPKNE